MTRLVGTRAPDSPPPCICPAARMPVGPPACSPMPTRVPAGSPLPCGGVAARVPAGSPLPCGGVAARVPAGSPLPCGGVATRVPAGSPLPCAGPAERGQATVELVVLLPLLVGVVLAAAQLLAAGAARELAGHAAAAGAVAVLQGGDPAQASRAAVPGWSRDRLTVRVNGRRVSVRMRPPSPLHDLGDLLAVTRRADAGPPP